MKYIFIIEAENHFAMLARITGLFSRSRIQLDELHLNITTNLQRYVITATGTKERTERIYRKIEGQVDVISVTLFAERNVG